MDTRTWSETSSGVSSNVDTFFFDHESLNPESDPEQTGEHRGRLHALQFLLHESSVFKTPKYILLSLLIPSVIQTIKYFKTDP